MPTSVQEIQIGSKSIGLWTIHLLRLKILNMHRSKQDFFPTPRQVINEIKMHYSHSNMIRTSNLFFGCFLAFSFRTSIQKPPPEPWRLQHFPPYPSAYSRKISWPIPREWERKLYVNCHLAKTNTFFFSSVDRCETMHAYVPDKFENTHKKTKLQRR